MVDYLIIFAVSIVFSFMAGFIIGIILTNRKFGKLLETYKNKAESLWVAALMVQTGATRQERVDGTSFYTIYEQDLNEMENALKEMTYTMRQYERQCLN